MQKLTWVVLMLSAVALAGSVAVAGDAEQVTLEGKIICAKCSLHEEGRDKCQNVLAVEADGETEYYYLAENETSDQVGPVCTGEKIVQITGSVTEKDGKMWLAATEIVSQGAEG